MKTSKEYSKLVLNSTITHIPILLKEIQNEAYNQCLQDLIENDLVLNKSLTFIKFHKS